MQTNPSLSAAGLALAAITSVAVLLPAAPTAWSQGVIAPTAPDVGSPAAGAEATEGYEVLMRGPLHEAFASPIRETGEGEYIELPSPPPEPIAEEPAELQPRTSNQQAQWIPGYWGLEEETGDLCWISGTWRFAPPGRRWLPGYWAEDGAGSVWVPGSWIDAETATLEYLPEPPPLREDWQAAAAAPAANQFWVPGQWVWQGGGYEWRSGFWSPAHDDWVWVPAHYVRTPRGCFYVSGYWDYQPQYRGIVFAPIQVYPSYYHRLAYRPRFAIDLGLALAHLFVRPNYYHYYFGDYYGLGYDRLGFYPWTTYRRGSIYYDPLYVYFSLHRPGYLRDFSDWYDLAYRDDRHRPPRFYDRDADRFDGRGAEETVRTSRLVRPAEAVLAESGFRRDRLSELRRQELRRDLQDLNDFTRRRAQLETRRPAEVRRDGGREIGGRDSRLEAPLLGANSGTDTIDLRQLGRWGATRFGSSEAVPRQDRTSRLLDDTGRGRAERSDPATASIPSGRLPGTRETQQRFETAPGRLDERFGGDALRPGRAFDRGRSSLDLDRSLQPRSAPRGPSFTRPEPRQFAPPTRSGFGSARQPSFGRSQRFEPQGAAPRQRSFGRSSEGFRGGSGAFEGFRGRGGALGGGRLQRGNEGRGGGRGLGRRN